MVSGYLEILAGGARKLVDRSGWPGSGSSAFLLRGQRCIGVEVGEEICAQSCWGCWLLLNAKRRVWHIGGGFVWSALPERFEVAPPR